MLTHKFESLHEILSKNCLDYFAISETKLDASFPDAQFNVNDFNILREDNTAASGGLMVYIRSDIPHRRLTAAEYNKDGIETICIEVLLGKTKTVIACIYKHPRVKNDLFKSAFSFISDQLFRNCTDTIFIGDMNCDPNKNNVIKDICDTYNLCNLIKDPTCHKADVSTLLDVVLVSNRAKYLSVLNCACEMSDFHNFVGAATRRFAPHQKPKHIFYRSYKNFVESDYKRDITSAPFHVCHVFDDVDDMVWFTNELLSDIVNHHAPVKQKMIKRDSVPYMNSKLRKNLYLRNMARNKYKKYGKQHWDENRRMRNKVVALRKKSLAAYFSKNCSNHGRNFWKTVSPFITNKSFRNGGNIILQENEEIVVDNKAVCDIFNDYFVGIASTIGFADEITNASSAIHKHQNHPSVLKIEGKFGRLSDSFTFKSVHPELVFKKLKSINVRKATGYDNIPGKLLRVAHLELSIPFAKLINKCFIQSNFPDLLKCAELNPIYKKSDSLQKGNYRPVSVLTIISKLYESVMNDQMTEHFIEILEDLLCAYRKGHSCQALLSKYVDDWKQDLDNNNHVGTLFMDLSKAFDCLPHSLLISKLHAYGLTLPACQLVASYLSNRRQRVKLGDARSNWATLTKGVPQGSILGSLLFNVFINDLFYFIQNCHLYNYADDNSLSMASPNLDTVLSSLTIDGNHAIQWFDVNGMQANPGKFQFMLFSRKTLSQQCITLGNDTVLFSESCVKVLGVMIDENLNFSEHVSSLCNKAARQLNALARISKYIDVPSRKMIYNSFIVSNFTYCALVWHFCGKVNNGKIEKINERALRILYDDYTLTYDELLNLSNSDTVLLTRLKNMTLDVFKSVKKLNPPYLNRMFEIKDIPYETRKPIQLVQPLRHTTTYGLRTISYTGAKLWNDLPFYIEDITEMCAQDFKCMLKSWEGPEYKDPSYHFVWTDYLLTYLVNSVSVLSTPYFLLNRCHNTCVNVFNMCMFVCVCLCVRRFVCVNDNVLALYIRTAYLCRILAIG